MGDADAVGAFARCGSGPGPRGRKDTAAPGFICSFVGKDGRALSFTLVRGIIWRVSYGPDFMPAMMMKTITEAEIVMSSIDAPRPESSRNELDPLLPIGAQTVVIDQRTGDFTYSGTSANKDGPWVYRGKCVRGG